MRTALAMTVALLVAPLGWAAAETDVENPYLRDLPLQRRPISGGKQHQPTQAEVNERVQERGRAADARRQPSEELYQRVLKQSQQPTPRAIDPSR